MLKLPDKSAPKKKKNVVVYALKHQRTSLASSINYPDKIKQTIRFYQSAEIEGRLRDAFRCACELAELYYKVEQPSHCIKYSQKALDLAKKIRDIDPKFIAE